MKDNMNELDMIPMSTGFRNLLKKIFDEGKIVPMGADKDAEVFVGGNPKTNRPVYVYLLNGETVTTADFESVDDSKRVGYYKIAAVTMEMGQPQMGTFILIGSKHIPDTTSIDDLLNTLYKN